MRCDIHRRKQPLKSFDFRGCGPRWETRTPDILLPNFRIKIFLLFQMLYSRFCFIMDVLRNSCSTVSAHSTAVCSQTCGQKPLSEHPRDRGQKAVFIVCRSAADGCFVAPVCRIVPLLERLSKPFIQEWAAQYLHRYRQRIGAFP